MDKMPMSELIKKLMGITLNYFEPDEDNWDETYMNKNFSFYSQFFDWLPESGSTLSSDTRIYVNLPFRPTRRAFGEWEDFDAETLMNFKKDVQQQIKGIEDLRVLSGEVEFTLPQDLYEIEE